MGQDPGHPGTGHTLQGRVPESGRDRSSRGSSRKNGSVSGICGYGKENGTMSISFGRQRSGVWGTSWLRDGFHV